MNTAVVFLITSVIWFATAISEASVPWVMAGISMSIALRYFADKNWGILPVRDPLLLLSLFPTISMFLYVNMFDLIDTKSFLYTYDEQIRSSIAIGYNFIFAMLAGGACHLMLERRVRASTGQHLLSQSQLIRLKYVAILPVILSIITYIIFFSGRNYISIQLGVPMLANILLKSIYISYAGVFLISSGVAVDSRAQDKFIYLYIIINIFIFAILFEVRSPAIFATLFMFFLIGHKFRRIYIFLLAFFAPIILSIGALIRDPTLLENGFQSGMLTNIITFGDFMDTMRFVVDYVASHGPSWGMGVIGTFLGIREPLANIYARGISEEYFYNGGGFGFFFLADIYANFGFSFGIIIMFIIGYSISRLASRGYGTYGSFIAGLIYANSLAITRNELGPTLRSIFYCLFAIIIVRIAVIYRPVKPVRP